MRLERVCGMGDGEQIFNCESSANPRASAFLSSLSQFDFHFEAHPHTLFTDAELNKFGSAGGRIVDEMFNKLVMYWSRLRTFTVEQFLHFVIPEERKPGSQIISPENVLTLLDILYSFGAIGTVENVRETEFSFMSLDADRHSSFELGLVPEFFNANFYRNLTPPKPPQQ